MIAFPPMDDIDRIMAVMQTAFDPLYGEGWTRAQVDNMLVLGHCHHTLIGPDGNAPQISAPAAGFALSRSVLDEQELLLIAVDPQWQRRGLGNALLTRVLEEARGRGITRMFLEMRDGNPAETLYRINGFRPIGRRPKYYRTTRGDRIDAITFSREIN